MQQDSRRYIHTPTVVNPRRTFAMGLWYLVRKPVYLSVCLSLYLSVLLNVASRAMTRVTKDTRLLSMMKTKVKSIFSKTAYLKS